jgi:hypothetical protein
MITRLVLASCMFVLSCGGAAAPPRAPSSNTIAAPAPAPGEWATWPHDRKKAYMEKVVLPDAEKMFAAFDPKRYAGFTCKSCHSSGTDNGTYKMPNPEMPKLVPTKIIELAQTKPGLFIFMDGAVVPHTAKLLGQSTFDHFTMSGFGCFKCHTPEK